MDHVQHLSQGVLLRSIAPRREDQAVGHGIPKDVGHILGDHIIPAPHKGRGRLTAATARVALGLAP